MNNKRKTVIFALHLPVVYKLNIAFIAGKLVNDSITPNLLSNFKVNLLIFIE